MQSQLNKTLSIKDWTAVIGPIAGEKRAALTGSRRRQTAAFSAWQRGACLVVQQTLGIAGFCALPCGNAVFERVDVLLVDELDGEAVFEISHHPGLDLAEHDMGLQRRAVFRGDRGARQR
jgi:hypothetical protein